MALTACIRCLEAAEPEVAPSPALAGTSGEEREDLNLALVSQEAEQAAALTRSQEFSQEELAKY